MSSTIGAWISFALQWAMVPLATIWLFEGARRAVAKRADKTSRALAALGAALLLGNAAVISWGASSLSATLDSTFGSAQVHGLPQESLAQLSATERAEKSRLLAQINFASTGLLTLHYAPDGTSVRYAPTQTELQEREKLREGLAEARARMEQVRTKALALCIAAVVAVAAGIVAARQQAAPT